MSSEARASPLQSNDPKKPGPGASISYFVRAVQDYSPPSTHSSDMEQSDDGSTHTDDPNPKKKQKTVDVPHLTMKAGDVIRVDRKDESGWWYGVKISMETKTPIGEHGWLPSNYVEDFFSTIDPTTEDPVLRSWIHMAEYPADWLNYCYATGITPEQAAQKTEEKEPKMFLGHPLLVYRI